MSNFYAVQLNVNCNRKKPTTVLTGAFGVLNTLGIIPFPLTYSTLLHLCVCPKCFPTLCMHVQLSTHSLKPRLNDLSSMKPFWIPESVPPELPKPLKEPFISSLKAASKSYVWPLQLLLPDTL